MWRARVTLLALPWSVAAGAQGQADPTAAIAEETARINALTELQEARNKRVAEEVAPLKELAGEGKVELGDRAGEIEAWLLTSDTLGAAGALIATAAAREGENKIIVLAGEESLDFTPLFAVRYEIATVRKELSAAVAAAPKCQPKAGTAGAGGSQAARFPLIAALGAAGSVLQSDTTVVGVDVQASSRLLAIAVARRLGQKAVLPGTQTLPDKAGSTLQDDLETAEKDRAAAAARHACLTADGKSHPAAVRLNVALDRHAAMMAALTTSEGKEAPVITALKLDWLARDNPSVLRVYVEKTGGTLLTRKNLWTALGAPAVGVTGGLVASFTKTDPRTGRIEAAGLVTCRTRLASIRAVQRGPSLTPAPCYLTQ